MRARWWGGLWSVAALLTVGCGGSSVGRARSGLDEVPLDAGFRPSDEGPGDVGRGDTGGGEACVRTQGSWGAASEGGGSTVLLRDGRFGELYPQGLVVGCAGGSTLTLSSAHAVEALLPASGAAGRLTGSLTDPTETSGGAFAGDVVALQLNVDFAARGLLGPGPIDSIEVQSGACAGMSVGEVLEAARAALGGCPASLDLAQLAECVAGIDESVSIRCDTGGD